MAPEEWHDKSDRLCQHLQSSEWFTQAQTILSYVSFRQEPDLSPLWQLPQRWGLSRCVGQSLVWHLWLPQTSPPLQAGAYGIPEPQPDTPTLDPDEVDLILVPAVACDDRGYRLGYGAGFYDRMLSLSEWQNKRTIGIVFEFAHLPELPIDPWDQPLDAVCTEAGLVIVPC
jgi:5-formyltetrahydrofolate cyclo-ligase